MTLATLGPAGSDSENAARVLMRSMHIEASLVLCGSFDTAVECACERAPDGLALIPAAYQDKDAHGITRTSWADLHFRIESEGRLELWAASVLPLKEMALAVRRDVERPRTVALHAATDYYARRHCEGCGLVYFPSKPAAVKGCSEGAADACIGSVDVIEQFPDLRVVRRFVARMCWTLYRGVGLRAIAAGGSL